MTRETLAWHFVGRTLRDGRPVPADGVELRHDGPVELCASGLHASVRAINALLYAPGATACRVVMRDVVATDDDKLVARSRTILWRVDATEVLREFARNGAFDVLHVWATPETPDIDAVVEYLLTGDESLQDTARAVARAAAREAGAAGAAAWNPAWDAARATARAAMGDAAWDVAWDVARNAARAAARAAARDAWVAGDAVWVTAPPAQEVAKVAGDAVWDAQNTRLERMLEAAR